jgi:spoIIIJ-associated protein
MSGSRSDRTDARRPDPRDAHAAERPSSDPEPPEEAWTPEEDLGEPEVAEAVGSTVEEAIENALEILGAREDEVEIEVLETGRRGFLGLGARRPFRVRVTWIDDLDEETIEEEILDGEDPDGPSLAEEEIDGEHFADDSPDEEDVREDPPAFVPRPPAPASAVAPSPTPRPVQPISSAAEDFPRGLDRLADAARATTEDLLSRMGMSATVAVTTAPDEILISVDSPDDDALLIGRRGETRAALEHLVQRLAIPREEREIIVHLDVNGYWQRRVEGLRTEAQELAAQAIRDDQEIRTEPLSAQERRVIHRALVDDERVMTESIGTGSLKRVAIIPASRR